MHETLMTAAKPVSLRRKLIWGAALLAVAGGIAWVVFHPRPQTGPGAPGQGRRNQGPMPVVAATVAKADLDITMDGLGTVASLATVTVKTQIAGTIQQIAFKEGQMVKQGDFLMQIDPRPYQAQFEQYSGQLLKDKALLKQAEIDLKRYKTLLAEDSIASQTVDTQDSLVEQYKGTVATDQAQVDNARLNITYCHIVSPVSGRAGLRQVDIGNYVTPSDANGLVVVTQVQPISVTFPLSEDRLPAVLKQYNKGSELKASAYAKTPSDTLLAVGKLDSIDSQIDTTTGTIKMRALFNNEPQILFPNQFVNVVLLVDTLKDAKIIPSAARQNGAPGDYVYLIKDDNTVTVRKITVGPQSGDKIAVLSGLEFGDKVVVDGADKLREGAQIVLPGAPAADAAQQPPQGERKRRNKDGDTAKQGEAKPQ
jgi:multidrug efflux system membrane fusion protein